MWTFAKLKQEDRYIDVQCWNCERTQRIEPGQYDALGMVTLAEFEQRAKCSECGMKHPRVSVQQKPGDNKHWSLRQGSKPFGQ